MILSISSSSVPGWRKANRANQLANQSGDSDHGAVCDDPTAILMASEPVRH